MRAFGNLGVALLIALTVPQPSIAASAGETCEKAASDRLRACVKKIGKLEQKCSSDMDMAVAKLKATEMLAMVADEALQIHGGMGLMTEMPLERIWRDARIERIWDGTSEVQRHIISRALLRPLGG